MHYDVVAIGREKYLKRTIGGSVPGAGATNATARHLAACGASNFL
jgi:hypothetical protein